MTNKIVIPFWSHQDKRLILYMLDFSVKVLFHTKSKVRSSKPLVIKLIVEVEVKVVPNLNRI